MGQRSKYVSDGLKGLLFGIFATMMGGLYAVYAQQAPAMGLDPLDLLAFRYGVAGLVLLPVFLRNGPRKNFAGLGPIRASTLAFFGGTGFVLCFFSGFQYAPLSHGAVIPPGTSAVFGAFLALWFRGEGFGFNRLLSLVLILSGLALVSGSGLLEGDSDSWKGDILFIFAGMNWAIFLLLLAKWKVPALIATAIISVLTAVVVLPYYGLSGGYENLSEVSVPNLLLQIFIQGAAAGVLSLYLFARAASYLSVAIASALPGLVPIQALFFGAVLFGLFPTWTAMAGVFLVILGQLIGANLLFKRRRKYGVLKQP